MPKKKKKRKVGSSYITMRKINGKRRKVKVTKLSRKRYRVRVVGAKKRKARRKPRRRTRRKRRR